jgi:HK97 family phage prohead protease
MKDQIITREIGERVDVVCGLDPTTVKDLKDGVFEATVTTSEADRSNENILTSGIDTTTWAGTGMPVLYGHDYSGLPIGKGLSFKTMKNKMTARFQLAVEEYPFAKTVAALIKGGYLNSVSIGGIVREWTDDYKTIAKMEMVEFSVVPVPANASAIITQRSLEEATGKSMKVIKNEFEEFRQEVLFDKLKGMPENKATDAIKVLKDLIARLEETLDTSLTDANSKRLVRNIVIDDAKAVATQSQVVAKTIKLTI